MHIHTSKNTPKANDRLKIPELECSMHKMTLKALMEPFTFPQLGKRHSECLLYRTSQES